MYIFSKTENLVMGTDAISLAYGSVTCSKHVWEPTFTTTVVILIARCGNVIRFVLTWLPVHLHQYLSRAKSPPNLHELAKAGTTMKARKKATNTFSRHPANLPRK